jgi:hypothetical protein
MQPGSVPRGVEAMTCIAGFDPNAFGPFGAIFQNYVSALESFGQSNPSPLASLPGFDPQAAATQVTAPFKAVGRCQLEVLGLANRRAQAYMQVPTRYAQCRTPQELINEQMAFWRTASEQYADSSRKITEAWTQAFPWAVTPWMRGVSEATQTERDYISFNGTGSKDASGTGSSRKEQTSKQRRVA